MAERETRDVAAAVLTRVWNDAEAELILGLLRSYEIYAWTASDVPHSLYPLTVDGLGEVRVMVSERDLERAAALLAEHSVEFEPDAARDDA